VLLGADGTPESRQEFARVIAEWESSGRRPPAAAVPRPGQDLSDTELLLAFWRHAERHYRHPAGTPTRELKDYRYSVRELRTLYGQRSPARGITITRSGQWHSL
jgi:hypothetical protein